MIKKDDPSALKELGSKETKYNYQSPTPAVLETFPNQFPHRDYVVEYLFNEFTSLCPKTGQPDFATITLQYIPNELCIETKSLKLYYLTYRQHGSFMETIVNNMLEHFVAVCSPRWMKVEGRFNPRGATYITVIAEHNEKD